METDKRGEKLHETLFPKTETESFPKGSSSLEVNLQNGGAIYET